MVRLPAAEQPRVRGVHDRVDREARDVAAPQPDAPVRVDRCRLDGANAAVAPDDALTAWLSVVVRGGEHRRYPVVTHVRRALDARLARDERLQHAVLHLKEARVREPWLARVHQPAEDAPQLRRRGRARRPDHHGPAVHRALGEQHRDEGEQVVVQAGTTVAAVAERGARRLCLPLGRVRHASACLPVPAPRAAASPPWRDAACPTPHGPRPMLVTSAFRADGGA